MYTKALICCFAAMSLLNADTLLLRNGTRVEGTFMGGDARSVRFAVGSQVNSYAVGDVDSVSFVNDDHASAAPGDVPNQPPPAQAQTPYPPPQQSYPPPQQNYPPPAQAQNYPPPQQSYPPPAQAQNYPPPQNNGAAPAGDGPLGVELPAGSALVVRLIDPVNSDLDHLGQSYRASIDQPVVVDGQTVIPRGADVVAVLTNSQKSGKIEGRTSMTLDLQSVTLDGRKYDIQTGGVTEAGNSQTVRSAKVIGGTAALGAIIGAIAGGGKGAAIGTLAGAGAGTAAQVYTSGAHVKIPAETRLTFSLTHPLDL